MTRKNKIKIGIASTLVLAIAFCGVAGVRVSVKPTAAHADSFDHSGCQYPDRTTNPVDGCDNTDPCDPAQVKGGSGDCVDPTSQGSTSTPEGDKEPPYSDPDRPYYDAVGNEYDYQGNLIKAAPAEAVKPATSCTR